MQFKIEQGLYQMREIGKYVVGVGSGGKIYVLESNRVIQKFEMSEELGDIADFFVTKNGSKQIGKN